MSTSMSGAGWSYAKRGGTREVTRQMIIDAALRLFTRSGPVGVRVEDIAREAGISRATFYTHFAERDEILTELFSRLLAEADEPSLLDGGVTSEVDLEARVRHMLTSTVRSMLDDEELARFVYSLPIRHDAVLPGGAGEPAVFKSVREALGAAADVGEMRDGVRVERVMEILGDVFESTMRDWALGLVEDPIERLTELLGVVFGGISAKNSPAS